MNLINFAAGHSKLIAGIFAKLDRIQKNAMVRQQVMQERQELGDMGDSQLNDIGRDWVEARRESSRSYFDVPEHRLVLDDDTFPIEENYHQHGQQVCQCGSAHI